MKTQSSSKTRIAIALVSGLALAAAAAQAQRVPEPSHSFNNPCALIAEVPGGESAVEAWALTQLNARLPMTFSGDVKQEASLGGVPVGSVTVSVDLTIRKPAKSVNVECVSSSFSAKFDIKVKVSGSVGSSTHEGVAAINGKYRVVSVSPPSVCVKVLALSNLNLEGVQNDIDNWISKKINKSGLIEGFCVP